MVDGHAAVPHHKTVAQLIPGKSGGNWVCLSGGDSPVVPYLLTMNCSLRPKCPFHQGEKVFET